jgi:hypothetical protein
MDRSLAQVVQLVQALLQVVLREGKVRLVDEKTFLFAILK